MPRAPQGPPNSYSNEGEDEEAGLTGGGLEAAFAGLVILTCLGSGLGDAAATSASCGGGSDARDVGAFFREGLAEGVVGAAAEAVGAMVARRLGALGVAAATAAAAFLLPGDRRARVLTMLACGCSSALCAPDDDGVGDRNA
jgi:hypothetical protein